jgi:hypothetical protein
MRLEEKDGPYGNAALKYIKAGWPEALPIWKGGTRDKQPMVRGYHGREGVWPDDTTNKLWAGRYARANIALRLPRWIVGLDVDHYGDKYGWDTLIELEGELGPLPSGPVSTAREDGFSGIRLFMVPGDYAGAAWPAQAGPDIDMITWYERYVICAPSIHKTGNVYRWLSDGNGMKHMPAPSDLSILPEDWCEYLVSMAGESTGSEYDGGARDWLEKYGGGEPCRYVEGVISKWLTRIENGSAHDAAVYVASQAVYAVCDGHTGVNSALWAVRDAFITRVSGRNAATERRRGPNKAVEEWRSILAHEINSYGGDIAGEDTICDELEGF